MHIAADARDGHKDERIERLKKPVAAFRETELARRSEKSDPDQFELALEVEPLSDIRPRTMAAGNGYGRDSYRGMR